MEIEPPDTSTSCNERSSISPEIEGLDIIINRCINLPDTDDNQEMKAILRASIDDTRKEKDALVKNAELFVLFYESLNLAILEGS
ncbi:hypothetical protein TNIN_172351 [Trichonephila inaurata madagascariensis]|uniref:Uncharacterized protein n=1 Tax=Trichonephila inaurata madagascariensis TaxID=2747483 RepID=A0A8X7BY91_9ARAC|nr:hypothetical protein TNIN_172351 [Trichonephila inaurata madagascariensis]